MIGKHFNCVRQYLRQLKIADIATVLTTVTISFILVLLKFPEGLQGCRQAMPLLIYIIKLMGQEEEISEELNCKV